MNNQRCRSGHFYFDDSVHDFAEFALGAFVFFNNDVCYDVAAILSKFGFDPSKDEYKSRINMNNCPQMVKVRRAIGRYLHLNGQVGIVIVPWTERRKLGEYAIRAFSEILDKNNLGKHHKIYFDEGTFESKQAAISLSENLPFSDGIQFNFEQDSKKIRGIQIADYAAHNCALQLKAKVTGVEKYVKAGKASGYDPDLDIELSFELFANLRYSMFHDGKPLGDEPPDLMSCMATGYYIAESCNDKIKGAANRLFKTVYLGCIH